MLREDFLRVLVIIIALEFLSVHIFNTFLSRFRQLPACERKPGKKIGRGHVRLLKSPEEPLVALNQTHVSITMQTQDESHY
jgi:hypothetical protein